jgi:hypothetical protein
LLIREEVENAKKAKEEKCILSEKMKFTTKKTTIEDYRSQSGERPTITQVATELTFSIHSCAPVGARDSEPTAIAFHLVLR